VAVSQLLEAKTLPEIIDIEFRSVAVGQGEWAVQALLSTNIATFSGIACYTSADGVDAEADPAGMGMDMEPRDYSELRDKVCSVLMDLDPSDQAQIDSAVANLSLDPAESLAISIAACRATARHSGRRLHEQVGFLAGLSEADARIPVPVVSVLSWLFEGAETEVEAEVEAEMEIDFEAEESEADIDAEAEAAAAVEAAAAEAAAETEAETQTQTQQQTQDITLTPVSTGSYISALHRLTTAFALVRGNKAPAEVLGIPQVRTIDTYFFIVRTLNFIFYLLSSRSGLSLTGAVCVSAVRVLRSLVRWVVSLCLCLC
jgi:hypothetical protein